MVSVDERRDPFNKAPCDRVVIYTPDVLRSALFNAIAEAQVADVKLCVDRGANLEWRDTGEQSCGLTTLQAAVCSGAGVQAKVDLVRYLLQERCGIEDIDYVESTALHFAAASGCSEVVDLLLKHGANPKVYDAEALTPLHLAVNNGHLAAVRALLNNWAPVDLADTDVVDADLEEERGAGMRASARVSVPGASLYIAKRGTALHVCAASNRVAIARFLIEKAGADVNSRKGAHGCTPLHIACRAGHIDVCRLLIDSGADLNIPDDTGETPLHRSIEHGDATVVTLLLNAGADACSQNVAGITPLHLAAAFARQGMLGLLAARGADVNARCSKVYADWDGGRTPLHYAAHNGDLSSFRTLVSLGADLRALSFVGWPALFYAAEADRKEIVEFIAARDLEDGVHCLVDKGRTPLMVRFHERTRGTHSPIDTLADAYLTKGQPSDIASTFLLLLTQVAARQGAVASASILARTFPFTVNMQDDMGRTALHWAALRSEHEVMEAIIEAGGNPNVRDRRGCTCKDLFPNLVKPAAKRQWEEERHGPQGEVVWNYKHVMENTTLRYMKRTLSARRTRVIAHERQCSWCQRYSFDAKRCAACKATFYCSSACQKLHWTKGGHRLECRTKGLEEIVTSHLRRIDMMACERVP